VKGTKAFRPGSKRSYLGADIGLIFLYWSRCGG